MVIGFRGNSNSCGHSFVEHQAGKNIKDREHRIHRTHGTTTCKKFAAHGIISFAAALPVDFITGIVARQTLLAKYSETKRTPTSPW
jgi:hypothetical protein